MFSFGAQRARKQTFRLHWGHRERVRSPSFGFGSSPLRRRSFRLGFRCALHVTLPVSWHLGTARESEGISTIAAFDQHSFTRPLRAFPVGCGDSEDGPDMPVLMKPGLGPGEQLTT